MTRTDKTPRDAVTVLLEQATHAINQARQIRAVIDSRPDLVEQLFAADTVAAALIQQAIRINDLYNAGVTIPESLRENTRIYRDGLA